MDNGSSGRLVNHEEGRGRGNRITPPLPRRQQRRRRRAQQHAAAIQTNDETTGTTIGGGGGHDKIHPPMSPRGGIFREA